MADRAVGVTDMAAAQPIVGEYRTRERTVNALTVDEQFVIRRRERVESSVQVYTHEAFVSQTADATTGFRWLLRNPTGSGVTLAFRIVEAYAMHFTNNQTLASAPTFTLERWTSTGTASGGTTLTPGRTQSGQVPKAVFYTAAPTGLTNAKVATFWTYFPSVNFTTTSTDPRAHWPMSQDYHNTDPTFEIAAGEAIAFRQNEASGVSESNSRAIVMNVLVEEFTRP